MKWIDTHCHLFMHQFAADLPQVMNNAKKAAVSHIILPSIDNTSVEHLAAVCKQYPALVHPSIGLHPTHINQHYRIELEKAAEQARNNQYIAIGEIGMDLYWDATHEHEQADALIFQLNLAVKLDLPVIIHSRNAYNPIYKILKDNYRGKVRGVFHAFSGNSLQAKQLKELGFYIGIGGVVTYKNSGLRQTLKETGLSMVIMETDAPFLTPEPYRGKRNEPAYIPLIAQHIADATGTAIEEVSDITTTNAKKLFGIE